MKKMFLVLSVCLLFGQAHARSLASIYNGQRYTINGYTYVQGADDLDSFYIIPSRYKVAQSRPAYAEDGSIIPAKALVTQTKQKFSGAEYVIYDFALKFDLPSKSAMTRALLNLQQVRPSARILGLVPICGLELNLPTGDGSQIDPDQILATYSLKSSASDCSEHTDPKNLKLSVRVPIGRNEGFAEQIASEEGIILPPISLTLPTKYKDTVKIDVDAAQVLDRIKGSIGLTGSWSVIQAGIQANMEEAFNSLSITGGVTSDCQNPDKAVCKYFLDQAQELLKGILLAYLPLATVPDGSLNPIAVSDGQKESGTMFKVSLAADHAKSEVNGNFHFVFSSTTYSILKTQVQIDISKVEIPQETPNGKL